MIRLAAIGGLPGSGKTSLILSLLKDLEDTSRIGVIVNNVRSLDEIRSSFPGISCTSFPLTAPCGRARQFSGTLEKFISNNEVDMVITEPSGPCTETSAPLLNPLIAFQKDRIIVGPLFTVVNAKMMPAELNSRTTDGLRVRQQIDESDVVAVFSEDKGEADRCKEIIREVNPDCEIIFLNDKDGIRRVKEIISSDAEYSRALKN